MIDKATKAKIADFIYNVTIGNGSVDEDTDWEPNHDVLDAISFDLRRKLTGEEISFACEEWSRNVQQAQQP